MASDDYAFLRALFEEVIDVPSRDREAFLQRKDIPKEVADEVRRLLAAHERSCDLLDRGVVQPPPVDVAYIGSYRVIRELGCGGMGIVYLAVREDDAFDRAVAIKVIRKDLPGADVEARFRQERRILAALDHPNIARVLDAGTTADKELYCVMEFIDGRPIDRYCERNQSSLNERLELFLQLCDAVHYLHASRVIHRDIKPGNVLVTEEGTAKLVDFGIAKLQSLGSIGHTMRVTGGPLMVMTPAYASPEQLRGETITELSDVYSLGVMLYELLTGQHPYPGLPNDPSRIPEMLQRSKPQAPSSNIRADLKVREGVAQLRRRMLGDLDKIVLRAIQPHPSGRYQSAQELSDDVHRFLQGQPVRAQEQTVSYRAVKFLQRHRRAVGLCALLLLLAGIGTWQTVNATFERERMAAREADLEKVIEALGNRLPRWGSLSSGEQTQDLGKLCDALRAAASRAGRAKLVSAGRNVAVYLHQTGMTRNAEVRYRAAVAWKLLGDLQAQSVERAAAIESYRVSHRSLHEVAKLQNDPSEALRTAAEVEARLEALGQKPSPTVIAKRKDEGSAARRIRTTAPDVAGARESSTSTPSLAASAASEDDWLALKTNYREVAGRVAAARMSTKALGDSLAGRGFTINSDLAASLEAMNLAMEHADTAIGAGNYAEARGAINSARAHANRVLQHFGR